MVGQWEGGGTHTGDAFDDMPVGALPARTGKVMRFTGTTVLKVENGLITEEIGLDDGLTALEQLGLIAGADARRVPRRASLRRGTPARARQRRGGRGRCATGHVLGYPVCDRARKPGPHHATWVRLS